MRELEKKFSGKDVVLVANRRILPPSSSVKTKRPRSRTLTAVRHHTGLHCSFILAMYACVCYLLLALVPHVLFIH